MSEAIEQECSRTAHQQNAAETFRSGLMFLHKVNAAKSGGSNSTEVSNDFRFQELSKDINKISVRVEMASLRLSDQTREFQS